MYSPLLSLKAAAQNDSSTPSSSPSSISSIQPQRCWWSWPFPRSSATTAAVDATPDPTFLRTFQSTTRHARAHDELAAKAHAPQPATSTSTATAPTQEHSHQPSLQRTILLTCARYSPRNKRKALNVHLKGQLPKKLYFCHELLTL